MQNINLLKIILYLLRFLCLKHYFSYFWQPNLKVMKHGIFLPFLLLTIILSNTILAQGFSENPENQPTPGTSTKTSRRTFVCSAEIELIDIRCAYMSYACPAYLVGIRANATSATSFHEGWIPGQNHPKSPKIAHGRDG